MQRRQLLLTACIMVATGAVFAGCNSSGSTGDGCSGSLHCADPISRMSCSDPYCFYPPKGGMTQVTCCRDFGNPGDYLDQTQDPEWNDD